MKRKVKMQSNPSAPSDKTASDTVSGSDLLRVDCGPRELVSIEGLVKAHYASLYRYAFRLTGLACDAEDLVQQCFLEAQLKLHQLRDVSAARAWLYQILRSKFFRLCRSRKPMVAADLDLELTEVTDGLAEQEASVDGELLQCRLNELKEVYRVALLMFYFEEKSYEQIAAELDIPVGTVMSRLSRAKAHLKSRVNRSEVLS